MSVKKFFSIRHRNSHLSGGAAESSSFAKIAMTATVSSEIPPITETAVNPLRESNREGLIVQSFFFPFHNNA